MKKTRINDKYVFNWHKTKKGIRGQLAHERTGIKYFVPREVEKMISYPVKQIEKVLFVVKMRHGLL